MQPAALASRDEARRHRAEKHLGRLMDEAGISTARAASAATDPAQVQAIYHRAMPTPVTGRCNLHTAATYGQPLGVQCRACERRVLVPLDKISGHGDMTVLRSLPLKCSACGWREVELWLFVKRDEAEAWADEA